MNRRRVTAIFATTVVVISLSGCISAVVQLNYFSPTAEHGKTSRPGANFFGFLIWGPGENVELNEHGVPIVVEAFWVDAKMLSIGPPLLPVVPLSLSSIERALSFEPTEVQIRIQTGPSEAAFELDLAVPMVLLPGTNEQLDPYRVEHPAPGQGVGRFGSRLKLSAGRRYSIDLHFAVAPKDTEIFYLDLDEMLLVEGEQLRLPKIRFSKSKGLFWFPAVPPLL